MYCSILFFFNAITQFIGGIDFQLYRFIHLDMANDFFDVLMPIVRNKISWLPLYLIVLVYVYQKHRSQLLQFAIASIVLITVSDMTCAKILKDIFERTRPCNDVILSNNFRSLIPCSGGYSLPSCHSMNHFALAGFWSMTLFSNYKIYWILWACLIAFAQVYVGVHYPSDVLVGGALGWMLGYMAQYIFHWIEKKNPQ